MKCCINIDDPCAEIQVQEVIDKEGLMWYCLKQDTCEDFDPIWTERDAENAIKEDMVTSGNFTSEEVEDMFTDKIYDENEEDID